MKINNTEYTSNLLCHFVGRAQTTEASQYRLLLKIIKEDKVLYANVQEPNKSPGVGMKLNYTGENQGELFEWCDCVCFCDIPNSALDIHRSKYSSFGMGFKKDFLIEYGARPVMYIPQNCTMNGLVMEKDNVMNDPYNFFNTLRQKITAISCIMPAINSIHPFSEQINDFFSKYPQTKETLEQFALKYLSEELSKKDGITKLFSYISGAWATQCAYVKLYDNTLPDNDLNNFYMEREWRCRNNIPISINDIDTIYLPSEKYKLHFVNDVPEYNGDFYIFE